MDNNLYLTAEEIKIFQTLPADVQSAWADRLQEETLDSYETPEQLRARLDSVTYEKFPEVKKLQEKLISQMSRGKAPTMSYKDFPEDAIPSFLFSIGACGMSAFLELMIQDAKAQENSEMMEAIAALSQARHQTLESNKAVFA